MELILYISEPDYGQLITAAMPLLESRLKDDGSFLSRLGQTALKLPPQRIGELLDSLPPFEISALASAAVSEYEGKLLALIKRLLSEHEIDAAVSGISLSPYLECRISISHVNYGALAQRFLPMLPGSLMKEGAAADALTALMKLPTKLIEKIPQKRLEQTAVQLITKYEFQICKKLEALAQARGFDIELISFIAKI